MAQFKDLTGMRFGEWQVIRRVPGPNLSRGARWLCKCSCGDEHIVRAGHLNTGASTKCVQCAGRAQRLDLTGQHFGKWEVLEETARGTNGARKWLCKCECGAVQPVHQATLRRGKSTQCRRCWAASISPASIKARHYARSDGVPVYFIQAGAYVKIGASNNVKRRLGALRVGCPLEPVLLDVCEDFSEEDWHKIFAHRHHRGEWYYFGE